MMTHICPIPRCYVVIGERLRMQENVMWMCLCSAVFAQYWLMILIIFLSASPTNFFHGIGLCFAMVL